MVARTVLIDSPGLGPGRHWSADFVADLDVALVALGVPVDRLGVQRRGGRGGQPAPLHRVAAGNTDVPAEIALTRALRVEPAHAVVHAGAGARGSPNLLWIAARMGSASVAVVRVSEVVCQRGDLVDRDGRRCDRIDDPERCTWCCRESFWRRPKPDDFRNRLDLVVAGLQACSAVWAPDGDDLDVLERVGVPARLLRTAPQHELAVAVAAELPRLSASPSPA